MKRVRRGSPVRDRRGVRRRFGHTVYGSDRGVLDEGVSRVSCKIGVVGWELVGIQGLGQDVRMWDICKECQGWTKVRGKTR